MTICPWPLMALPWSLLETVTAEKEGGSSPDYGGVEPTHVRIPAPRGTRGSPRARLVPRAQSLLQAAGVSMRVTARVSSVCWCQPGLCLPHGSLGRVSGITLRALRETAPLLRPLLSPCLSPCLPFFAS